MPPLPQISTLFPYTTLFRSELVGLDSNGMVAVDQMGAHTLTWSSDGGSTWEDVALPLLPGADADPGNARSEEHTSELQSHHDLVCRLLLEKKKRLCCSKSFP